MTPDEKRKDVVRHYETEAGLAREITHLKDLLAHAVPLAEHFATVDPLRAFAESVGRHTTGYQCWHIAEARRVLALAFPQTEGDQDALPFREAT